MRCLKCNLNILITQMSWRMCSETAEKQQSTKHGHIQEHSTVVQMGERSSQHTHKAREGRTESWKVPRPQWGTDRGELSSLHHVCLTQRSWAGSSSCPCDPTWRDGDNSFSPTHVLLDRPPECTASHSLALLILKQIFPFWFFSPKNVVSNICSSPQMKSTPTPPPPSLFPASWFYSISF